MPAFSPFWSFFTLSFLMMQGLSLTAFAEEIKDLPLIPVAMGNRWEYRESEIRTDGTVESTRPIFEEIRGFYDAPNGRFFYLDATDYCMWLRNTPKGQEDVMLLVDEETTKLKFDGKPGIFFRYPVDEGMMYLVDYQSETIPVVVIKVTDLNAKVEVPAGKFTCIKYESIDKHTRLPQSIHYVCPGVGPVKYESYEGENLVSVNELTKYELKDQVIPKQTKDAKAIMPLVLGNTWIYQGESVETDRTTTPEEASQDAIRGMYQSEQGLFVYLESTDFGLWIQNTPQGNRDVEIVSDEETSRLTMIGKPTMYYRFPAEPGTTYDLVYGDAEEGGAYSAMTLVDVGVEVTVPAGTFDCVKYESHVKETGELERIEYVSPGTGLIRTEEYLDDKLTYSSVLTRYKLNP